MASELPPEGVCGHYRHCCQDSGDASDSIKSNLNEVKLPTPTTGWPSFDILKRACLLVPNTIIQTDGLIIAKRGVPDNTTNGISQWEAFMLLFKSTIGCGILFIPYGFAQVGALWCTVILSVLSILASTSLQMLVRVSQAISKENNMKSCSYSTSVQRAMLQTPCLKKYADLSSKLVSLLIIASTYSGVMLYVLIISINLKEIVQFFVSDDIPLRYFIASMLPLLIPINVFSNLRNLTLLTLAALVSFWVGVVMTIPCFFVESISGESEPNYEPFIDLSSFVVTVCIGVISFSSISIILPIENNMKEPSSLLSGCPTFISYVTITVFIIYFIYGITGFVAYGDSSAGPITMSLPQNFYSVVVKALISLGLYLSSPIVMHASLAMTTDLVKSKVTALNPKVAEYLSRWTQISVVVIIPFILVDMESLLNFITGVFATLQLIFPAYLDTIVFVKNMKGARFWFCALRNVCIILIGHCIVLASIYAGVLQIVDLINRMPS